MADTTTRGRVAFRHPEFRNYWSGRVLAQIAVDMLITGISNLLATFGWISVIGYLLYADADGLDPRIPFAAAVSALAR